MSIEIQGVTKTFGDFVALRDVTLNIPSGGLVSLLGPSGSGKTSLLRIIAGLDKPDRGRVFFNGEDISARQVQERKVGFVFQHYALFRHMTVFENIAFGLRVLPRTKRPSEAVIRERVHELLKLIQVEWLSDHYPSQLSGGQRQRVALARALAIEPQVLLLDEPFGSLDAKVRKELRRWLRRLHDDLNITSVFVTHDQEEALEVSDTVVVMNEGSIQQIGAPDHVYTHPASQFVYQFLGSVNLFHGRMHQGKAHISDLMFDMPEHADAHNVPAVACVRPHDIEIMRKQNGEPALEATVVRSLMKGALAQLELRDITSGKFIEAEMSRERFQELGLKEGETVFVFFRNPRIFLHSD